MPPEQRKPFSSALSAWLSSLFSLLAAPLHLAHQLRMILGGGPAKQLTDFKIEGRLSFDWSRDGKQLVFVRRLWTNDLVLLRNLAPKGF